MSERDVLLRELTELRSAIRWFHGGLLVLRTMLQTAGLRIGAERAFEMIQEAERLMIPAHPPSATSQEKK